MFNIDKTEFSVVSLSESSDDKAYWQSKTPSERLQALEATRQVIYGYDPITSRFQRFFEVVELKPG
jgi:hypothetical protein